jgi:hypothetical protein
MKALFWTILLLVASTASVSEAASRRFVLGASEIGFVMCPDDAFSFCIGGVIFPAGVGGSRLTIADDVLAPTSGFYDQDLDGDGSLDGVVGTGFCGSLLLFEGGNWNPGAPIVVLADGPVYGSPLLSTCGTISLGITGVVTIS